METHTHTHAEAGRQHDEQTPLRLSDVFSFRAATLWKVIHTICSDLSFASPTSFLSFLLRCRRSILSADSAGSGHVYWPLTTGKIIELDFKQLIPQFIYLFLFFYGLVILRTRHLNRQTSHLLQLEGFLMVSRALARFFCFFFHST